MSHGDDGGGDASATLMAPLYCNRLSTVMPPVEVDSVGTTPLIGLSDILQNPSSSSTTAGTAVSWDVVILSNYMTDLEWILSVAPTVADAKEFVILYGEGSKSHLTAAATAAGILHKVKFIKPPLPIAYGTHHSKAAICISKQYGIRVSIFTANFIVDDWERKNQAVYVQDFPLLHGSRKPAGEGESSTFAEDLTSYCRAVGVPAAVINLMDLFDFSAAAVRLVTSVPGYHQLHRGTKSSSGAASPAVYGLERLRCVLQEEIPAEVSLSPSDLSWQYSSQGSLTDKFLADVAAVMMETRSVATAQLNVHQKRFVKPHDVRVVFPTESEVRNSVEGWRGGGSIPVPMKNCHPYINARYHLWTPQPPCDAVGTALDEHPRCRAMPHIKSYVRLPAATKDASRKKEEAEAETPAAASKGWWVMITSANLSRAAWGEYQKKDTQLGIRSYELGVLATSDTVCRAAKHPSFGFTMASADSASPLHLLSLKSRKELRTRTMSNQLSVSLRRQHGLHVLQLLSFPSSTSAQADPSAPTTTTRSVMPEVLTVLPYDAALPVPYASTAHLRHKEQESTSGTATSRTSTTAGSMAKQDVPWVVDGVHRGVDALGYTCSDAFDRCDHYGSDALAATTLQFRGWRPLEFTTTTAPTTGKALATTPPPLLTVSNVLKLSEQEAGEGGMPQPATADDDDDTESYGSSVMILSQPPPPTAGRKRTRSPQS